MCTAALHVGLVVFVMAAEGKAIIFYRCNLWIFLFFYFVSIYERPAMGSRPNLASRSEVESIYKCPPPKKMGGLFPKFRGQNIKFLTTFSRLLHSTPHISGDKRRIDKPKCYSQSTMCPLKVDLLSVTFDPETAEIRSVILTHPMKIQHFLSLPGFPHKGHWTQTNQILPDVRGLKDSLSTVKILGKSVIALNFFG